MHWTSIFIGLCSCKRVRKIPEINTDVLWHLCYSLAAAILQPQIIIQWWQGATTALQLSAGCDRPAWCAGMRCSLGSWASSPGPGWGRPPPRRSPGGSHRPRRAGRCTDPRRWFHPPSPHTHLTGGKISGVSVKMQNVFFYLLYNFYIIFFFFWNIFLVWNYEASGTSIWK